MRELCCYLQPSVRYDRLAEAVDVLSDGIYKHEDLAEAGLALPLLDQVVKYTQCPNAAVFEINDLGDGRDTGTTYSCEDHVGPMLGHAEGWNGKVLGWQVSCLNPLDG